MCEFDREGKLLSVELWATGGGRAIHDGLDIFSTTYAELEVVYRARDKDFEFFDVGFYMPNLELCIAFFDRDEDDIGALPTSVSLRRADFMEIAKQEGWLD
jgi:hypothetical protein